MDTPQPIDVGAAIDGLTFLPDRSPTNHGVGIGWAADVADYRDGAMFVAHYAGQSAWERHAVGDEIVMVLAGETTMTMVIRDEEHQHTLGPMQMVIVPQGTWHAFDTPESVTVMTVTPQPTEHQAEHPLKG